ncbi:MAG: hypothetical protein M3Q38_06665, partial [Chloroflexota bacterium]|nr:hypothetical protein [Chloroflexota bacterium]
IRLMRVHAFIILAIAAVLCGAPSPASATGPNSLSAPQASPTSATTETPVSFSVTYAGGFAARTVTVNVAGRTLPMGLVGGTEMQGTWSAAALVPQGTWEATFLAVASPGKDPSTTGPAAPAAPAAPATIAPAATPAATSNPAAPAGSSGEASTAPEPAVPVSSANAPATGTGEGPAPEPSADTASQSPGSGEASGAAASGAAAPRSPERTSAAEKTSIPAEPALGPIDLIVGAGGVAALTLLTWFVLLATRRRRAAPADGPLDDERPRRRGTAEEEVTATLHRRTLRRSKMRPDEDVIVASMGSGMPSAESAAHRARRTHRRSPPN